MSASHVTLLMLTLSILAAGSLSSSSPVTFTSLTVFVVRFYCHSLDFVITQISSTLKINNSHPSQVLSFFVARSVFSVEPAPWIHWTTLTISHSAVSSFLYSLPYPTYIPCSVTLSTLVNFLNSLALLSFWHLAFLSEFNYWPSLLSIIAEKNSRAEWCYYVFMIRIFNRT